MGLLETLGLPQRKQTAATATKAAQGPTQRADGDEVVATTPPVGGTTTGATGATPPTGPTAPVTAQPLPTPPVVSAKPKTPAPTVKSDEVLEYAKERRAVKGLVDALSSHVQAARISGELGEIATKMASATAHAVKLEWPGAMSDLGEARTLCATAKKHADEWIKYAKRRAVVAALGTSLRGMEDTTAADVATDVANADGMMKQSPPDFTGAMALLKAIDDYLRPDFKDKVDSIKDALKTIQAMDAAVQRFLADEIAKGLEIVSQLNAAFAAKEWSQVVMLWRHGWGVLGGAERYGQRRALYNTQRALTLADITAVKSLPAVHDRGPGLDTQLVQADALASHDTLKMEAGVALLKDISLRCEALKKVAPTVASHESERALADSDFAALEKDAAAPQMAAALGAIRALLVQAAAAAGRAKAMAGDPTAQWQLALTTLQRARADIATAKTVASHAGPAAAASKAAAGGDAEAMKRALHALEVDAAAAGHAAHADQAKEQLDRCTAQAAAAAKALEAGNAKAAADPLRLAAVALAAARTIQTEHAQFLIAVATADAQVNELRALKTAKAIAPRIDPVANAIASARQHDARHDGGAAMAALRVATDGLAAARQADRDRQAYETLAKSTSDRLPEVTDAKLKKPITKALEDAAKLADALNFADATKGLKGALVQIDNVKLEAGMKSTPPDPQLRKIVKSMMANGGAASVDAAIQASPDSPASVITDLASARYGKEFSFEGSAPGANEVKSMKRCCEVFATIADDLAKNPSITNVSHVDATNSAGGGYTGSSGAIGMVGRVGIQQKFGKNEERRHPKTHDMVKALPADIDPKCLPAKDEPVEYLGFAAAHEVGHGVDDLRGFMNKNSSNEKYGGWISYGGDVKPIADLIGADISGKHATSTFYKNDASKKYVLDKLMSRPSERPGSATPGSGDFNQADFNAYDAFDDWHATATSKDVYRRQGDCDKIRIGTHIYHEAYPRQWVGYLASARNKGLTGYQFRAPAEWFAELYAGWKCGRLGSSHPALEWLKKL